MLFSFVADFIYGVRREAVGVVGLRVLSHVFWESKVLTMKKKSMLDIFSPLKFILIYKKY